MRRLPWYLAYLKSLQAQKDAPAYVSSTRVAQAVGVAPSQIAKDLSMINIAGRTRIGYHLDELVAGISDFLGFDDEHRAVVIGAGSLGRALMADNGLTRFGLKIVAGFDSDPAIVGTDVAGIPVYDVERLAEVCQQIGDVRVATVTVPATAAQAVADAVVAASIPAIWNFTPGRIVVPDGTVVQDTSIYSHLAVMYNRIKYAGLTPLARKLL